MYLTLFTEMEKSSISYNLNGNKSLIRIDGSSTEHDWSASVKDLNGSLKADIESGEVKKLNSMSITAESNKINSGNSSMNSKMYTSLKTDEYPQITFKLTDCTKQNSQFEIKGKLTVAGITKTITSNASYSGDQIEIKLSGSFSVKMTDFKIDPPKLFLGLLKTGNEVNITYSITFNKSS